MGAILFSLAAPGVQYIMLTTPAIASAVKIGGAVIVGLIGGGVVFH